MILNKKKLTYSTAIGVVVVAVAIFLWNHFFGSYVSTNDAQVDGYKTAISSDLTARIIKLYVDEGSEVNRGDLLVELDDSILQSEKREAEAKIATLKASIVVAEHDTEKLRNDFNRALKGFEEAVVSSQQLDHAEKDYLIARSKLRLAQKELSFSEEALGVIMAKLLHTKIFAPFSGKIVKRWTYEGDVMNPGQAIFSLYDLNGVWIVANLEETKMAQVKIGNQVEVTLDTYPGIVFPGKIWVIKEAAASQFSLIPQDNATGNYTKVAQRVPLKIQISSPPLKQKDPSSTATNYYLFPGMSAEVRIKIIE